MASKKEYNPALEVTRLSIKCQQLESKLIALQEGRTIPEDLPTKADNLRQSLKALKLKMRRNMQPEDNLRKLALEAELGRVLLLLDGVL